MKRKISNLIYVLGILCFCIGNFSVSGWTQEGYEFVLKWGEYGTGDGQFYRPYGNIGIDSLGCVYVSEHYNNRVQKFTGNGEFLGWWGLDDLGNAGWHEPGSGRVGVRGSGDGQFSGPWGGVAINSSGNVYVADTGNHRIQKFTSEGTFLGWLGGDDLGNTGWHNPGSGRVGVGGSGDGQFWEPSGIAFDSSENIYMVEYRNHRVQKFTSDGIFLGWWGLDDLGNTGWHNPGSGRIGVYGSGDGQFSNPWGIAIDSLGNVYVSESDNHRVQKFTSNGEFLGWWGLDDLGNADWHEPGSGRVGSPGSGDGQFYCPEGIAFDSSGNAYVTDRFNNRIQKFTSNGEFLGWLGGDDLGNAGWHEPGSGRVGSPGSGDGQFDHPEGSVAFDSLGNLYVVDRFNHRIQKFAPLFVQATVDIKPNTLNLKSKGKWITGYIELPSGYDVNNIDITAVKLNNTVSAEQKPTEVGDYDKDGIPDLMVKFDRAEVEKIITAGDEVKITISGQLTDGKKFAGSDTIRVISPPSSAITSASSVNSNSLGQNYPNPFNPATTIEYAIAEDCQVMIKLYNAAGQEVATIVDEYQSAGPHKIVFDAGERLSRGIYYYQLKAGSFVDTKKMVVLK